MLWATLSSLLSHKLDFPPKKCEISKEVTSNNNLSTIIPDNLNFLSEKETHQGKLRMTTKSYLVRLWDSNFNYTQFVIYILESTILFRTYIMIISSNISILICLLPVIVPNVTKRMLHGLYAKDGRIGIRRS